MLYHIFESNKVGSRIIHEGSYDNQLVVLSWLNEWWRKMEMWFPYDPYASCFVVFIRFNVPDHKHYLVSEEDDTIHKTIQYTDHDAILHEYDNRLKSILAQQNTCLKSTHFFICFLPLYFKSLRNMKDVKMIMMMKCSFKCGFRMEFINVSFKLSVQLMHNNRK